MTVNDRAEPVYLRLRGMLAEAILEGRYREGDHLPSVRSLAAQHGANPLTVSKAYQALQDEGYVVVRRGVGMFVADGAVERLRGDERAQFIAGAWPRIRAHIDRLGLDMATLVAQSAPVR